MINYLIRLATHLDTTGLHREAAYLDGIIKRAADQDEVGAPILPMSPDADTVAGPGGMILSGTDAEKFDKEVDRAEAAGDVLPGETAQDVIRGWIEIIEAAEMAKGMNEDDMALLREHLLEDYGELSETIENDLNASVNALKLVSPDDPGELTELKLRLQDALLGQGVMTGAGEAMRTERRDLAYQQGLVGGFGETQVAEASALIRDLVKTSDTLDRSGMTKESDCIDKVISLLIPTKG